MNTHFSAEQEEMIFHRGDIYLADLNPYFGSEQGGTRPVLVLQNDAGNFFSPTLIIATMTSRVWKKVDLPTHYILRNVENLAGPCVVQCEQIRTIDKRRIKKYLASISREQMAEVDDAIRISLHLDEDTEFPEAVEAP